MNRRHVQKILSVSNAQKSRRLLKCLRPQPGHCHQLDAGTESALFIPELDNLVRHSLIDAGHITQERERSSIQIDAHSIHTGLDRTVQRFLEPALIDIMLILSDTD